jgi:hypothetical protein
MRVLIIGLMTLLLVACSETDPRLVIPKQKWRDTVIEVQPRVTHVRPGMEEFVIIITLERGKPVRDLIVSLRADPGREWEQAIQDGYSGVYRRAIYVGDSRTLYMQLRRKMTKETSVLKFPLPDVEN